MSIQIVVKRHHLIISKLRKGSATFNEILNYLNSEGKIQEIDFNITKKTFRRDLDDIVSIYDIEITYDTSQKVYYIEMDASNDVSKRMLEAFDTFNALNLSERLSDNIYFENNRAKGTENLYGILHAIKNLKLIIFTHHKHWEKPTKRQIEPFALKEYSNLWYVVGKDLKDKKIKTFALDRITNIEISRVSFQMQPNFSVNNYFKHSFGIMRPYSEEPQDVILSFNSYQGKYIKDLPLHHTQEILIDNDNEVRIKLKIYITIDFEMEIMKYGETVKVIQPEKLSKKVALAHKEAIDLYE